MIAYTAEKSQTTEPQSGSSASKGNTSKKSSSTNPTQGHQTAYKSQEKSISASTKVGEAGTSKAKKRPSDASGPSATKVRHLGQNNIK